jgi:hypothetical protein
MEVLRPEPDLATTHHPNFQEKIVMEREQKLELAIFLLVPLVSMDIISAFFDCVLEKTKKLKPAVSRHLL